jgi:hypothetical protein
MYLVGIKELQTMNDVSEASFVSSGVLRQNGGNQIRNVMYSFVETVGNFRRKFLAYDIREGSCNC